MYTMWYMLHDICLWYILSSIYHIVYTMWYMPFGTCYRVYALSYMPYSIYHAVYAVWHMSCSTCYWAYIIWYISVILSVMSDSLWPHGLLPARLLWPLDFPGKNTRLGCHFHMLYGIFHMIYAMNCMTYAVCVIWCNMVENATRPYESKYNFILSPPICLPLWMLCPLSCAASYWLQVMRGGRWPWNGSGSLSAVSGAENKPLTSFFIPGCGECLPVRWHPCWVIRSCVLTVYNDSAPVLLFCC